MFISGGIKMFKKLKLLKLWQKILVLLVVAGIGWGIYGICIWAGDGSGAEAGAEENTVSYTVRYGDLTSTIYASGSLVYATSEQLTFDSAGTVEDVYVEKDDTVEEGDVLARLDSESIEFLEETAARARIALRDAEEALEDAQNPYSEADIADAEEAVGQAQMELIDAQERGEIQIANAGYAVDRALKKKNDSLVLYMSGQISFDEYQVSVRDWELEELDLEMVKISVKKSVSAAEDKLENAGDALEEMLEGADALVVELKEAELKSAQTALDDALEQLESAKNGYPVLAPFDGVVARVNVEPGDEVNANTVVIELVDSSSFEVSAIVDEIDVAILRLGQDATVTLDALPELELRGNVSSISAFAQSQSGVVSYPVSIGVTTPEDVQLLQGMSATATIDIELASNALLVPSSAVRGTGDREIIMVMVDGQPQLRMVTTGATDGVITEVVTGLEDGDEVIVEVATGSESFQELIEGFRSGEGFTLPEGFTPPGGMMPGGGGGGFFRQLQR